MSNSRCFSQLNGVKTTKLSRENLILKNYIFLPRKDQCILVARSCPKVVKKVSNRLENLAFGKFLVNVNCMNNFLKSKFQTFLKTLKSGCSDVQRDRYSSRKSCVTRAEFSRETMFCKFEFFVLRNDWCLFMTPNTWNFHFFEKRQCFLSAPRVLRVLEVFQFHQNRWFWGISSSDSGAGKNSARVSKSSKSRGGSLQLAK